MHSNTVQDITDETFAVEVLKADKPTIVQFWAEWCGPCRAVSPIIDQIAAEHADKIKVVRVNVDHNPYSSYAYGIASIPTMKVFDQGELVLTAQGAKPKEALEAEFAQFLA
jgi:thioredoxin 1